jgi:hypothetical protein
MKKGRSAYGLGLGQSGSFIGQNPAYDPGTYATPARAASTLIPTASLLIMTVAPPKASNITTRIPPITKDSLMFSTLAFFRTLRAPTIVGENLWHKVHDDLRISFAEVLS